MSWRSRAQSRAVAPRNSCPAASPQPPAASHPGEAAKFLESLETVRAAMRSMQESAAEQEAKLGQTKQKLQQVTVSLRS